MLIGLSGTHGTGKSTILQAVKSAGYHVDESQLSRAAQKSLGWDKLSKAQESVENMWQLQDAIIAAMYDRDQAIIRSGEMTVVERTPADVWAYTYMWCKRLGINDNRMHRYKFTCRDMANTYRKFIVVPQIDEIPFVAELNRADLESRDLVETEINNFIESANLPMYRMRCASRENRQMEIITEICKTACGA